MKDRLTMLPTVLILISSLSIFLATAAYGNVGSGMSLRTRLDNANIQAGMAEDRYLEILVSAPETEAVYERNSCPPMHIALVIDRSGSMRGAGKMGFVKEAARSIVERLRPIDRLALIAYDDRAEVLISMQQAINKAYLIDRINSLYPRGSTNLGEGLLAGYREIRRPEQTKAVNRVILLSDGLANQGITSVAELSGITSGNYAEGVSLSTLGVGAGFNENLMTTLAMDGGGMYYYIDHPSFIPEILAREFSTMQSLIASNIILHIEFSPDIGIRKVIGNRYEASGRSVVYNVGELSTGERRRYMIHLHVPRLPEGRHPLGKVRLQYTAADDHKERVHSQPFFLNSLSEPGRVHLGRNEDVIERIYIFEVNEARKKATLAVDLGATAEAEKLLFEAGKRLQNAPVRTDRLEKEYTSISEYASLLKRNPRGEELRRVQKKAKYKAYILEGC